MRRWLLLLCLWLMTGCELVEEPATPPPDTPTVVPPGATPTATAIAEFAVEAASVMRGICFEAAFDAAGQVFVLRSAADQIRFYDLADHSRLCRHPVERVPFDFSGGRVLAGLWSKGTGCTARHDILSAIRDEEARRVTIALRFITEGDCDYELVRPFWLALDQAAGYAVEITVSE